MEKLRRTRPFLLLMLLGLPLITPLLRWTAVPCTHDDHLHYHRIAALRYAWEHGLYFSRWLPDLAFGYGYPFFIYREPAPLYLTLFPHLLGLPLPVASNLFYALTILACGWFMFLWVRDVLDERAALVAAVAYMAAPYVLIDALVRGNLPESLALPLLPLLLWSGRRWLLQPSASSFAISSFGLAFLSLSHNISTFLFAPALLVYLLALGWQRRLRWQTLLLRLALLFGLGLGMTLFYTGGALLEMNQVTLQRSTTALNNDFHYNFTTLAEIFAPVSSKNPLLINPPLLLRLGWVPVALAIVGIGFMIYDLRLTIYDWRLAGINRQSLIADRQLHGWLMVAGTAVFLFLSLSLSRPLWENVPLVDFVQFPWRFIGRAALPIAFLAGLPFAQRQGESVTKQQSSASFHIPNSAFRVAVLVAVTLLILESIPNLYPNFCTEEGFPTISTVHHYEHETGMVGVDPVGSYFPRTVGKRPSSSPLEADYEAGQTPQRFDTAVLPPQTSIQSITYAKLDATIHLTTLQPFTAQYLTFAFPGWVAAVDGPAVPITPSDPDGLITFPVPAGKHTLTIAWRSTPLRTALTVVSILAFVGVLAVLIFCYRLQVTGNKSLSGSPQSPTPNPQLLITDYRLLITDYRLLITLSLLLLGTKLLLDRVETPLRRTVPPPVENALTLQDGALRLDGFNLNRTQVPAGESFDIDMAWTAVTAPQVDYQTNVLLIGPDGLTWSDWDTQRPRLYEDAPRTRFWLPGQWAWDSREVVVFSGTPPGQYDIVLTLFDRETLQPVTLLNERGEVVGPTAVLGQIEVVMPATPPTFAPQQPLDTAVGSGLQLLGYNQDRDTAAPGDSVLLTLFWQKAGTTVPSTLALQLVDEEETAVNEWQIPLSRADFDLAQWQNGQRLRGQHFLRLPAGLASGRYHFVLEGVELGELAVTAPERVFEMPMVETAVSTHIPFTDPSHTTLTTLAGYTIYNLQSPISLELVWQANAEIPTRYRVFVHLVDENGSLITQSDGEPANWSRPTTGWAAGEYITDPHQLTLPVDLPTGPLTLRVGLYDPESGQRLQTPTGDFVTIPLP